MTRTIALRSDRRDAILGGGVAGLVLAWRLAQAGRSVVLIEREPGPGGLAAGFRCGSAWLEKFYHHLFRSDRTMRRLIEEVGLAGDLVWGEPPTKVFIGGREHRLDSARTLLRFEPLPIGSRLRMGAGLVLLRALPDPAPLEGWRAERLLRQLMGNQAVETVWLPQLRAKFGSLAGEIAAPWFWARVHDRTTSLGYLRGGFQRFYERLAERIADLGGELRFGTEVTGIERRADGTFTVSTTAGRLTADRVVSTLPTRLTCRLAPQLPEEFRDRYGGGSALGAHCLILALDRPLTTSYWLSILDPSIPFMALVEHTNWLPPSDYEGRHLVYLGVYRPMDDPVFAMSGQDLLAAYAPGLARVNPSFEPGWVREAWAFAAPFAQPIVDVDFKRRIPPHRTPLDGLWIVSMFQVYPHDRGQNYSAALAERVALQMQVP